MNTEVIQPTTQTPPPVVVAPTIKRLKGSTDQRTGIVQLEGVDIKNRDGDSITFRRKKDFLESFQNYMSVMEVGRILCQKGLIRESAIVPTFTPDLEYNKQAAKKRITELYNKVMKEHELFTNPIALGSLEKQNVSRSRYANGYQLHQYFQYTLEHYTNINLGENVFNDARTLFKLEGGDRNDIIDLVFKFSQENGGFEGRWTKEKADIAKAYLKENYEMVILMTPITPEAMGLEHYRTTVVNKIGATSLAKGSPITFAPSEVQLKHFARDTGTAPNYYSAYQNARMYIPNIKAPEITGSRSLAGYLFKKYINLKQLEPTKYRGHAKDALEAAKLEKLKLDVSVADFYAHYNHGFFDTLIPVIEKQMEKPELCVPDNPYCQNLVYHLNLFQTFMQKAGIVQPASQIVVFARKWEDADKKKYINLNRFPYSIKGSFNLNQTAIDKPQDFIECMTEVFDLINTSIKDGVTD